MKLREMDEEKLAESGKMDEALLRRRFNRRVDGRRLRDVGAASVRRRNSKKSDPNTIAGNGRNLMYAFNADAIDERHIETSRLRDIDEEPDGISANGRN